MIIARLVVYAAILCTLWLNGSYAWAKGGTGLYQYAAVAIALTIDAAKSTFLAAAAHLAHNGHRTRAAVLVMLWPFALAYSTFASYASLTTNRARGNETELSQAQARARAQTDYDAATAALATATASPLWTASAACTAPKNLQAKFCQGVAQTKAEQAAAAATLSATKVVTVDPEVTAMGAVTGLSTPHVMLLIALWPAVLLELVASLGFYALHKPATPQAPQKPAGQRFAFWRPPDGQTQENPPAVTPRAAESIPAGTKPNGTPPRAPVITWSVPARRP